MLKQIYEKNLTVRETERQVAIMKGKKVDKRFKEITKIHKGKVYVEANKVIVEFKSEADKEKFLDLISKK